MDRKRRTPNRRVPSPKPAQAETEVDETIAQEASGLVDKILPYLGEECISEDSYKFVLSMGDRLDKFKLRTFVSDKQIKWLRDLRLSLREHNIAI